MGFPLAKATRIASVISVCALASCTDSTAPSKPTKLAFIVQPPGSVIAGAAIRPGISVAIQDEKGNTISDATDEITISLASNPADGKLAGPQKLSAVAGVATFSDLFINKAGTGYKLSATANNLAGAVSTALDVSAGPPQSLSFVVQPVGAVAGTPMPAVAIAVKDAAGNTVTTATNRIMVGLALSGSQIAGDTASAVPVAGVATINGLSASKAGSDFRLLATSNGLSSILSQSFSILPGPPAKLAFTTQPEGVPVGELINAIGVEIQDAFGNRATSATNSISIALGSNPSGAALSGTINRSVIGGAASFSDLRIDKAGANYTMVAASPGLQSVTSRTFNIRNILLATGSAAGYFHSCGVEVGGAAYCWGDNSFGQLGNTVVQSRPTPAPVEGGLTFTKIVAGRDHTCGLVASGSAYCWGTNAFGQLGSQQGNSNVPLQVAGGLLFADISDGYDHTCGVTTGGAGYCWGSGASGELGNNKNTPSPTPGQVSGGIVFTEIGAGRYFTCGVATDRKAYCWGSNDNGQLGNGTTSASFTPVAVSGDLTFATVSAGGFHSCGLTTTGAAYCWGSNFAGQLGNGTKSTSTVPVAVSGEHVFVTLSVGNRHNCAVTATGEAYCWGDNSSLNLGIDSNVPSTQVPALVAGNHSFATISAGRFHTCGVTINSELYCWGGNGAPLGTGATSTPVPVRVR